MKVLDFMYCGDIEINIDNAEDILRIADFLLFEDIKDYCRQFFLIHGNLNLTNCLWISVLSEHHNLVEVADVAKTMVKCRFHDYFIHGEEILDLPESIFLRLLRDAEVVQFTGTDSLVRGMLRWIRHDLVSRQQHLRRLLSCVAMQSISDDCAGLLLQQLAAPQQYPEIVVGQLSTLVHSQADVACRGLSTSPPKHDVENNGSGGGTYDDLFLAVETSERVIIAVNCNTAVKFLRFYVYNIAQQQWYILPVHSETVLRMVPPRLSVCSMMLHEGILYMFLSYNLPYPTDMLRINVMAFDIELGQLVLLTFQHRLPTNGCCQTTLTDDRTVPPVLAYCAGCLIAIGNTEGAGQIYICDPASLTYTRHQIPGTRFISLARAVVKDDRYVYIWCRHRFGHEEYCVNKEVTFAMFDMKDKTFPRPDFSAPPGVSYSEFGDPHVLCVEDNRVIVHTPGKISLVLDEEHGGAWFTHGHAVPAFPSARIPADMPYIGHRLYTFSEDGAYVFGNPTPYVTTLAYLPVGQTVGQLQTPPPVDGISLVTAGYLLSSFFDALPECDRFDDGYARLIHKKTKQLYDTDTEESATGQSAESSGKEDNYDYDGFEYDDDIYGYFDDYEYERNINVL